MATLKASLENMQGLAAAFVHGSFAKGRMRPQSDIDVALLPYPGKHPSSLSLLRLAGELEDKTGYPVHFGILSSDNLIFAREVISCGQEIFCHDPNYWAERRMHFLSMYADFNISRKPVLEAYRKSS